MAKSCFIFHTSGQKHRDIHPRRKQSFSTHWFSGLSIWGPLNCQTQISSNNVFVICGVSTWKLPQTWISRTDTSSSNLVHQIFRAIPLRRTATWVLPRSAIVCLLPLIGSASWCHPSLGCCLNFTFVGMRASCPRIVDSKMTESPKCNAKLRALWTWSRFSYFTQKFAHPLWWLNPDWSCYS